MWLRYAYRTTEFTEEEMARANATNRLVIKREDPNSGPGGAVGRTPVVPPVVRSIAEPGDTILDFGSGKAASHAIYLRDSGLNVTPHDFGSNIVEGIHDPEALTKKYDIVYASNVLNVQISEDMLRKTLSQIASVVKPGGKFIANYPAQPRKIKGMGVADLAKILGEYFSDVSRVPNKTPIFICVR